MGGEHPGTKYNNPRHNVGFRVVDKLAAKHGWKWTERRSRAILASGMIGSEKGILAKPITFMNRSGEAVSELVRWDKGQTEDILIICDDLDLPVGRGRLRTKGSAGGHNGLGNGLHYLHT